MQNDQQFIANSTIKNTASFHSFTWEAPSNIALIKYWGKSTPQLPKNASLSFTLSESRTITTVEFTKRTTSPQTVDFTLFFDGIKHDSFKPKIANFFLRIAPYTPFLQDYQLCIKTKNTFPHSSGIASSASGMAALALCIMSLEKTINPSISEAYFYRKASFLARLGSGSASRSVEGPLILWGKHSEFTQSSDLYAIPITTDIDPIFNTYKDTILLVDEGEKQVSSTVGHELMHHHPFAETRFEQANKNLSDLLKAMKAGDLNRFIHIVEKEALSLHAMMMTSSPYFILMKPNTLKIIHKIWEFRASSKLHLCFTLDAGANVHLLFPESEAEEVNAFILNELLSLCQNKRYICDSVGLGATQL
ncbi:diphosphomevalonate decarboxylase [Flavobacteriaceae bacterium F08102]|nr:diphosphomevalonate decarboxylase [Flavobacteriaceae bacterium F08102]